MIEAVNKVKETNCASTRYTVYRKYLEIKGKIQKDME